MENQHRQIKGYRELSQQEIDLMNQIKAKGLELDALLGQVHAHVQGQIVDVANGDEIDHARVDAAQPQRWIAIARTDFQTGLMALTRAVAQPTFF
jgi:hypothetical protein